MSFTHNRPDKHTEVYSNSQLNSFRCIDSIDIFFNYKIAFMTSAATFLLKWKCAE